jgi:hypothetical protein
MRKIFQISLLMFIAVTGYSQLPHQSTENYQLQCDSNKTVFIDSLNNEIGSNHTKLVYNGIDSLFLNQLEDEVFKNLIGAYPGYPHSKKSNQKYCVLCREEAIKIVDSIDINNDGVKELFLLRQWYCSATPSDVGPYGEGGQQLGLSKYEVWNVKSKKKIFEVKNMLYNQIAVSTSVVKSSSCKIDININEFGTFILSNQSCVDFWNMPELGTYIYDNETNAYRK